MLTRQCTIRKSSRTLVLRELLEGAFFTYADLFGAYSETSIEPKKETVSLMKLNQNHCSIRSILHAGIIGHGLQAPMQVAEKLEPEMQQMFLGAIAACCKSDVNSSKNTSNRFRWLIRTHFFTGYSNNDRWFLDCFLIISRDGVH